MPLCLEGRNATQPSPQHTAARMTQDHLVPSVNSAMVEKPCSTAMEMNLFSIPKPETHFLT